MEIFNLLYEAQSIELPITNTTFPHNGTNCIESKLYRIKANTIDTHEILSTSTAHPGYIRRPGTPWKQLGAICVRASRAGVLVHLFAWRQGTLLRARTTDCLHENCNMQCNFYCLCQMKIVDSITLSICQYFIQPFIQENISKSMYFIL